MERAGGGAIWPPAPITHPKRWAPPPPGPMRARLMRSFPPTTRAWAGAARPTTPRATPAPTADFTNSRRPSLPSCTGVSLESEFYSELHVALVGLGQHAAEGCALGVDAHTPVGGCGGVAVVGIAEAVMVREVEKLRAQLQPVLAADGNVLEEGDVPIREPGAAQDVAAGVAEGAWSRGRECCGIEPEVLVRVDAPGELRVGHLGVADEVPGLRCGLAYPRVIVAAPDGERPARLEVGDTRDLPAAQDPLERRVLVAPEWQLVEVVEVQHMGAIVVRDAPVADVAIGVEKNVAFVGGVVSQPRVRVVHAEAQAVAEATLEADLKAVVDRATRVLGEPDDAEP